MKQHLLGTPPRSGTSGSITPVTPVIDYNINIIADLTHRNDMLKLENKTLLAASEEARNGMSDARLMILRLEQQNMAAKKRIHELDSRAAHYDDLIKDYENKLGALKSENAVIQSKNNEYVLKIEELHQLLENNKGSKAHLEFLEKQITVAEEHLDQAKFLAERVEDSVRVLSEATQGVPGIEIISIETLGRRLLELALESRQMIFTMLEEENNAGNRLVGDYKTRLISIVNESFQEWEDPSHRDARKSDAGGIQVSSSAYIEEMRAKLENEQNMPSEGDLFQSYATFTSRLESIRDMLNDGQVIAATQEHMKDLEDRLARRNGDVDGLLKEIDLLNIENANLVKKSDSDSKTIARIRSKMTELDEHLRSADMLREDHSHILLDNSKLTEQLKDTTNALQIAYTELGRLQKLETEWKEIEPMVKNAKAYHELMNGKLIDMDKRRAVAEALSVEHGEISKQAHSELAMVRHNYEESLEAKGRIDRELELIRKRAEMCEKENEALDINVQTHSLVVQELQSKIYSYQEQAESLIKSEKSAQQSLADYCEKYRDLELRIAANNALLENQSVALMASDAELRRKQGFIEELQSEIEKSAGMNSSLAKTNNELKVEKQNLERTVKVLTDDFAKIMNKKVRATHPNLVQMGRSGAKFSAVFDDSTDVITDEVDIKEVSRDSVDSVNEKEGDIDDEIYFANLEKKVKKLNFKSETSVSSEIEMLWRQKEAEALEDLRNEAENAVENEVLQDEQRGLDELRSIVRRLRAEVIAVQIKTDQRGKRLDELTDARANLLYELSDVLKQKKSLEDCILILADQFTVAFTLRISSPIFNEEDPKEALLKELRISPEVKNLLSSCLRKLQMVAQTVHSSEAETRMYCNLLVEKLDRAVRDLEESKDLSERRRIEMDAIRVELNASNDLVVRLRNDLKSTRFTLSDVMIEVEEMRIQLRERTRPRLLDDLISDIITSSSDDKTQASTISIPKLQLSNEISVMLDDLVRLRALESTMQASERSYQQLKGMLTESIQECEVLQKQLTLTHVDLSNARDFIGKLTYVVEDFRKYKSHVQELQNENKKQRDVIHALRTNSLELRQNMKHLSIQIEALHTDGMKGLNESFLLLSSTEGPEALNALTKRLNEEHLEASLALRTEHAQLKRSIALLNEELIMARIRNESHQNQHRDDMNNVISQHERLKDRISILIKSNSELISQLKQADKQNASLHNEINDVLLKRHDDNQRMLISSNLLARVKHHDMLFQKITNKDYDENRGGNESNSVSSRVSALLVGGSSASRQPRRQLDGSLLKYSAVM